MLNIGKTPLFVLASQSQYKKQQLKVLGIDFDTFDPHIDESPRNNEHPKQLAQRLADEKALSFKSDSKTDQDALVLGSDQTAWCNNILLGKPHTLENAIKQLRICSGKTVTFYSAITLFKPSNNSFKRHVTSTHVTFKTLTIKQITYYVNADKPLNSAGSFKSEGLGIALFSRIKSTDPTALIGLPLIALSSLLNDIALEDSNFKTFAPLTQ